MKNVEKPIEVIAAFTKEGVPRPIKFRIENQDESVTTVKIENVIQREKTYLYGVNSYLFRCQSIINGSQCIFEIIYKTETCKWMLYRV